MSDPTNDSPPSVPRPVVKRPFSVATHGFFGGVIGLCSPLVWLFDFPLGDMLVFPGRMFVEITGQEFPRLGLAFLSAGRPGTPYSIASFLIVQIVCFALTGIAAGRQRNRSWRRESSLCIKCCYSLIGNVSGQCPECGTHLEAGPPSPP